MKTERFSPHKIAPNHEDVAQQIAAGNAYERRSSSLRCHSVCDGSRRASSARQRRWYGVPGR